MITKDFDIVVIGGGPAGLAASKKAAEKKRVLLIEREELLGGILKQCIHDGFGLHRYKEKLAGPEYADREIKNLGNNLVTVMTSTFVSKIDKKDKKYLLHLVNTHGVSIVTTEKIILATGCRERTSKQVLIGGTNPAGVMTAGQAQYYINILGKMPGKNFVILGSGDIGLIMARRITLEGGKVLGVYEVKSTPSGLARNIAQCLEDFSIPLSLSHTVTKVFGQNRLEAVEISKVDEHMKPIPGTETIVKCDALILSVGLIPENELAESLGVKISPFTKGPIVDQTMETTIKNVYSCGNAMHVNDLVDYVSESGEIAGENAAKIIIEDKKIVPVTFDKNFLYVVPQNIDLLKNKNNVVFYFRSKEVFKNKQLSVEVDGKVIMNKMFITLKPPEMERLLINIPDNCQEIKFRLEDKQ